MKDKQYFQFPVEDGYHIIIPLGITRNDFECLKKTLDLWEKKIVLSEPKTKRPGMANIRDCNS